MYDDFWGACQGAEFIIASTTAFAGCDCAAKLGVPTFLVHLQPQAPTNEFPSFNLPPWLSLGGRLNRLTHVLSEKIMWRVMGPPYNRWRQDTLHMPRLQEHPLRRFRAA
jgi:sterol 3beta-glucosyltransferase